MSAYRSDIDGLRALAVLAVIANHFDRSLLPNGCLGVDMFFVISGFVITQSLTSKQDQSFTEYILSFYRRRIKRLFPALVLCITLTSVIIFLISPPSALSSGSIRTGITALFGLSNLYLLRQATDYFGSSAEINPFTHTWSLGVEEQFYFIFPLLLWATGLPSNVEGGLKRFFLVISLTVTISLVIYFWLSFDNPIAAFYLMPTRFWEIGSGAIAYIALRYLQKGDKVHFRIRGDLFPSLALAVLLAIFIFPIQSPQEIKTLIVVLSTVIIVVGTQSASLLSKVLGLRPLVYIGSISYSLYLWHWSVLAISRPTVGVHSHTVPFQVGAIFLLAFLSYRYVERPLRHSEWRWPRIAGRKIGEIGYALIVALCLCVALFLVITPLHTKGCVYTGLSAPLIKNGVSTLKDNDEYNGFGWTANKCVLSSNDDVGKPINYEGCTFGDLKNAKRRVLVIGNSYSVAELEMYKVLVEEGVASVTVTSAWGASPVQEIENKTSWAKANEYYWDSVIPKLTRQLTSGDVLLMINDGSYFSPKFHNDQSLGELNRIRKGLERISEEMAQRDVYVVYQSGIPFMRESFCTPDSAMPQWWHAGSDPPCIYYTREESLSRRSQYHEILLQIEDDFENFAVLDLFDLFCPKKLCKFYNEDGVFLYRD